MDHEERMCFSLSQTEWNEYRLRQEEERRRLQEEAARWSRKWRRVHEENARRLREWEAETERAIAALLPDGDTNKNNEWIRFIKKNYPIVKRAKPTLIAHPDELPDDAEEDEEADTSSA